MSKNTKRSPEEKMEIVLEGLQNDNISETCRKHGITKVNFTRKNLLDLLLKFSERMQKPYMLD